jgi:phenylalanyl-tRNA synthetase beta chain
MQSRLAKLDQRPINLWVDLTNYIMFAVGQPCHAYDSAKLTLPLRIHDAKDGDALDLLDGARHPLDATTLVISDRHAIVDLAGIMGGKSSAVSGSTTELLFEAGNFDAYSIRRSSARMGLRTEASARFEKALDTQRVDAGQAMFVTLLKEIQPSATIVGFQDLQPAPTQRAQVSATVDFFRDRLGAGLDAKEIADQLALLGFDVSIADAGKRVQATAPTWRSTGDISIPNDLLEEVARIRGYDNFDFVAPTVELHRQTVDPRTTLQSRIRTTLALNGGMQEVVTYPWVHDSFLEALGMSAVPRLRLAVQPGENQGSLRPSLLPNLLEAIAKNVTLTAQFRIFELGRIFLTDDLRGDAPEEVLKANPKHLAAAFVGPDAAALFSQAKGMLETLRRVTHVSSLTFGSGTAGANGTPPAWADASGRLSIEANGKSIGFLGLVTKKARRVAGIKRSEIAMFELNVDLLEPLPSRENRYRRLPEQPESDYDVSMLFANEVTWQSITGTLSSGHPLIRDAQFVDEYRGAGVAAGQKSITIRLRIGADDKTLTSK